LHLIVIAVFALPFSSSICALLRLLFLLPLPSFLTPSFFYFVPDPSLSFTSSSSSLISPFSSPTSSFDQILKMFAAKCEHAQVNDLAATKVYACPLFLFFFSFFSLVSCSSSQHTDRDGLVFLLLVLTHTHLFAICVGVCVFLCLSVCFCVTCGRVCGCVTHIFLFPFRSRAR
jgi:hypothetical protein